MPTTSIVVTSTSTVDGVAFADHRRRLARMLGPHGVYATTSQSAIGEAKRQVLSTALASSRAKASHFDGAYLYVVDGAQGESVNAPGAVRQVLEGGYAGPRLGSLLLDEPFSAALASGVTFELSIVPVVTYLGMVGSNELIRDALKTLTVFVDLDLTYVTNQVRYALPFNPAMLRRDQIVDVYRPISTGYTAAQTPPRPLSRSAWDMEYDGEGSYLVLGTGFNSGETFFAKVRVRADQWVKRSGTWASSATGPVLSTDEVLYSEETVAQIALPIAYQRLAAYWRGMGDAEQAAEYEGLEAKVSGKAALVNWFSRTRGSGVQRVGATGGR